MFITVYVTVLHYTHKKANYMHFQWLKQSRINIYIYIFLELSYDNSFPTYHQNQCGII